MRKSLLLSLFVLFVFVSSCQEEINKPFELSISNSERCFVFSSLDWYAKVIAYDSNFIRIGKINVDAESKKQNSHLVFETFDFVYDSYKYFIFKKGLKRRFIEFNPITQEYHYLTKKSFKNEKKRHIK